MAAEKTLSIGIDLGTTNSLVAAVIADHTEILPNRENEPSTPSVVGMRKGKFLVGKQARNNAGGDPANTILSIKRLIGLPSGDPVVDILRHHVAYQIVENPDQPGALAVKVGDKVLSPEEVSAMVLRRLREDAEERLRDKVQYAVVTVPAYFPAHRRDATARAAAQAGFTLKAILDEPTAAALSECMDEGTPERARIIVFDFGGGTLDISLVERSGKNLKVVNYCGDNFLGGDDIDRLLVDHILEHVIQEGGNIDRENAALRQQLQTEAEKAKHILSSGADGADIVALHFCRTRDDRVLDVEMEITASTFTALLQPLVERVRKLMVKFMEDESYSPEDIDLVLMVGGSSAIPQFRQLLCELFEGDGKKRVRLARSPMEAVARGAAIFAHSLKGLRCVACGHENTFESAECSKCGASLHRATFTVNEDAGIGVPSMRLPRSLGVRYRRGGDDDNFRVILPKGTPYPVLEPKEERFSVPSGGGFVIAVHEGEHKRASANHLVGVIKVAEVPHDVKEDDPVVIGFSYTRNRQLFVTVSYPNSSSDERPRWRLDAPDGKEVVDQNDPLRQLTQLLPTARTFLQRYGRFMEQGDRQVFQGNLRKAETAIFEADAAEAVRLAEAITASFSGGCGYASTLFLAECTIANEDPQLGREILASADNLRKLCEEESPTRERVRQQLDQMIQRALERVARRLEGTPMGGGTKSVLKEGN
jgi:molecular chaperone DnaK (HSP70)